MKLLVFLLLYRIYGNFGLDQDPHTNTLPKLLIISLDGFRHEYLNRFPHLELNNFERFLSQGVGANGMIPVYPSLTQVNHQSIVTGLYPETHGIVSNVFYDPVLKDLFHPYKHPEQMRDPKWFSTGALPIWVTNSLDESKNRSTGVYCWPNSMSTYNGHSINPKFYVPLTDAYKLDLKRGISKVLGWYRHPTESVNLALLYYPNLDAVGHLTGTNSEELQHELLLIDTQLGYLLDEVEADPDLRKNLNIIIVSDHGMNDFLYTPEFDKVVLMNRILDESSYIANNEVAFSLIPYENSTLPTASELQTLISDEYPSAPVEVLTKADLAERYNFGNPKARNAHRIPPLQILPEPGWLVFTDEETVLHKLAMVDSKHKRKALRLSKSSELAQYLRRVRKHYAEHRDTDEEWVPHEEEHMFGVHGYGTEHRSMHALFLARGPAFRKGYRHPEPVRTIDAYGLFAHVLDLKPEPNNGTLETWRVFLSEPSRLPNSVSLNGRTNKDEE